MPKPLDSTVACEYLSFVLFHIINESFLIKHDPWSFSVSLRCILFKKKKILETLLHTGQFNV